MSSGSPPGWYPDPFAPGRLRFWDGTQWTADATGPRRVSRVWLWGVAAVGTAVGVVGVIVWVAFSMSTGLRCGFKQTQSGARMAVRVGFVLMVFGPLVGWVVVPVAVVWGREPKWLAWPILAVCAGVADSRRCGRCYRPALPLSSLARLARGGWSGNARSMRCAPTAENAATLSPS
jgi:hypothetical protein